MRCRIAGMIAMAVSCQQQVGHDPPTSQDVGDPLHLEAAAASGSLDDLFERVLLPSCAGQAGLCHFGQFEPNLSTPALAFANLVNAPSVERLGAARVVPGDAGASLLIDKLRNRNVISAMPLGANPLAPSEIEAIEDWIARGARRFEAEPVARAPNRAPEDPQIVVFNQLGVRLVAGSQVQVGDRLHFRMSTGDFETPDEEIPFAGFVLTIPTGEAVLPSPEGPPGFAHYFKAEFVSDAAPASEGELLNRVAEFTVPARCAVIQSSGELKDIETAGLELSLHGHYWDAADGNLGYFAYGYVLSAFRIADKDSP